MGPGVDFPKLPRKEQRMPLMIHLNLLDQYEQHPTEKSYSDDSGVVELIVAGADSLEISYFNKSHVVALTDFSYPDTVSERQVQTRVSDTCEVEFNLNPQKEVSRTKCLSTHTQTQPIQGEI